MTRHKPPQDTNAARGMETRGRAEMRVAGLCGGCVV